MTTAAPPTTHPDRPDAASWGAEPYTTSWGTAPHATSWGAGSDVASWGTGRHAWGADPYADVLRSGLGPGRLVAAALASGLLLGLTCYLSYGLTLIALIAAAVLWLTAQATLALLLNHLLYTGW
ncbi:hypothetical protein [Streptomyces tubercidicus]